MLIISRRDSPCGCPRFISNLVCASAPSPGNICSLYPPQAAVAYVARQRKAWFCEHFNLLFIYGGSKPPPYRHNQCGTLYIINRRLHIIKLCLYIITAFLVHFLIPQSFFVLKKMTAPFTREPVPTADMTLLFYAQPVGATCGRPPIHSKLKTGEPLRYNIITSRNACKIKDFDRFGEH